MVIRVSRNEIDEILTVHYITGSMGQGRAPPGSKFFHFDAVFSKKFAK